MRNKSEKRLGAVAAVVAICLVALISVVAISLDGGLLLDSRRRVQAAADAAALAAADDLFLNYGANNGLDPSGTAKASALATAAANGFKNDGDANGVNNPSEANKSYVVVNIPPVNPAPWSGDHAGMSGYAEVIITFYQQRYFSGIFGSGNLPVSARAVAQGARGKIGILILHPHLQGALEIRGNVNLQNYGQLYSNSDNTTPNDAASQGATGSVFVGPGVTLNAGGINVFNSLTNQGTVNYAPGGGLNYYSTPVADPLANLPDPTTAGLTNRGSVTLNGGTLQPGIYSNITITGGNVTMAPGLYYIDKGGSFSLNAGTLQGDGVMIVNNTQQDSVFGWNNPAQGAINLTPPTATSGGTWPTGTTSSTYNGVSMWVPRTWNQEVHFQSNQSATVSGTWYAQGAEYDVRANAPSAVFNLGNYICNLGEWNQKYGGNANAGTGTININPGSGSPTVRPILVE
jgi:hypothetical protein